MTMKDPIILTDAARHRIMDILSDEPSDAAVRFSVAAGGCAGMKYDVKIDHGIQEADQLIVNGQARVVIGPESFFFLLGCTIDYEITKFNSGFTYNNPNVVDACGCGESVRFTV
ncbi:MAG: iron-sulfur cluster assembly accessory protein [Alphaproteobacteria bacterium]|jgi:iron-sulfur cluster assembly protein|nr:iron-sulfur cluster assembly accessory protein [Alphaproteobacteria bacterium]